MKTNIISYLGSVKERMCWQKGFTLKELREATHGLGSALLRGGDPLIFKTLGFIWGGRRQWMYPVQSLELSHPPALTDPYPPNQILPIWLSFWFCLDVGSPDLANKVQVLTVKQLFVIDPKCKLNWASYILHGK